MARPPTDDTPSEAGAASAATISSAAPIEPSVAARAATIRQPLHRRDDCAGAASSEYLGADARGDLLAPRERGLPFTRETLSRDLIAATNVEDRGE
jgi:hypothetical protein